MSRKIYSHSNLKTELFIISLICFSAVASGMLGYFHIFKPQEQDSALWFQRSGSIMTVFSVIAQYRINTFLEKIRGGTFAESWVTFNIFIKYQVTLSWVITCVAIIGSIIWGYGDLIYCFI